MGRALRSAGAIRGSSGGLTRHGEREGEQTVRPLTRMMTEGGVQRKAGAIGPGRIATIVAAGAAAAQGGSVDEERHTTRARTGPRARSPTPRGRPASPATPFS